MSKVKEKISRYSPKNRLLFIVDVYGWAFENIARGIKKYSLYPIDIRSYGSLGLGKKTGVNVSLLDKYKIVVYLDWFAPIRANNWRVALWRKRCRFILAHWGHEMPDFSLPLLKHSDAFILGERRLYQKVKDLRIAPTYFLPEGVDTEFFKPIKRPSNRFNVGWAGNYKRPNKRTHLLKKLKYPVKIQSKHGRRFWVKRRNQNEMVNFYNSLDVYVYVSTVEGGQSTTILEAMASGLPVVTTNAGSEIRHLLNSEWILPINPPGKVVQLMNQKLDKLKRNPRLRAQVGRNNRSYAEERSWKIKAKKFDEIIARFY